MDRPLDFSSDEFPPADRAVWRRLAERGRPLAELAWTDEGGLTIEPLYTEARAFAAARLGRAGARWIQVAAYPDGNTLAMAAPKDVARGVTGVEVSGGDELNASLDKLDLAALDTVVRGGPAAARALLGGWAGQGVVGRGNLGLAPLTDKLPGGALADLVAQAPDRALLLGDLRFHQAGCTEPQGLAAAVASGVDALRRLTDAGLTVDQANAKLEFELALDPAFFLGLAKLRAFRVLWARVLEASGASARVAMLRARPSLRAFTQRDPWVNLLRNTATCFAGAIGGADAIVSLPFDAAIGDADALARRVARNTPTILAEESGLGQVADPAGGSHFIEALTTQLAEAAWAAFQGVERAGGLSAVLADGSWAAQVAAAAAERARRVADGRRPIVGVTDFPDADEAPLIRHPRPLAEDPDFPLRRDAAPYEGEVAP